MKFDESKVAEIVRLVRRQYEGWQSVDDPAFVTQETSYKREAAAKAQELLGEAVLSRLLSAGDYEAFIKRLESVGQSTNLMYLSHPSSGDMSILYQPNLDKAAFCEAMFMLLHDSAPVEERLDAYLAFVDKQDLPQKWTFATYYLFLLYPENELFIKPMTTKWLMELLSGPGTYPWTPSAEAYVAVRDLHRRLLAALAPYGATDMIDVQSIVWTAHWQAKEEAKRTLAEPFATMFADFDEANWAFDLLADMVERLGYRGLEDPRLALTLGPGYLRLNFGNWLVMEFPPAAVGVALLEEELPASLNLTGSDLFANSEEPVRVYTVPRELAKPFAAPLEAAYEASCRYIGDRFQNWRGSPFRGAHLPDLLAALFDADKREDVLTQGISPGGNGPVPKTRYWRITLPEKYDLKDGGLPLSIWEPCRQHNIAASEFGEDFSDPQMQKFAAIKPGDWVVAFLLNKRIGGIGEVTAAFDEQLMRDKPVDQDYWRGQFWTRLGVDWTPVSIDVGQLSPATANKFLQQTLLELSGAEFEEVRQLAQAAGSYDAARFLAETYWLPEQLADLRALMEDKKQLIFYGPPGTGKTYVAMALARLLTGLPQPPAERVEMVQFHPAFAYEDFIEGIRPESKQLEDGRYLVDYPPRAGIFRSFCERAARHPERPYVFIIDEINRGNIPRIFGELMLLLEYRQRTVRLPYSGEQFSIPANVYLIGTMNTADRSIALVDFALRRRFHFFHFGADPQLFRRWLAQNPTSVPYLAQLYTELTAEAIDDPAFRIGHSYFMDPALTEEKLALIWQRSIEPYLAEYYTGQPQMAAPWRWEGERLQGIRDGQSA